MRGRANGATSPRWLRDYVSPLITVSPCSPRDRQGGRAKRRPGQPASHIDFNGVNLPAHRRRQTGVTVRRGIHSLIASVTSYSAIRNIRLRRIYAPGVGIYTAMCLFQSLGIRLTYVARPSRMISAAAEEGRRHLAPEPPQGRAPLRLSEAALLPRPPEIHWTSERWRLESGTPCCTSSMFAVLSRNGGRASGRARTRKHPRASTAMFCGYIFFDLQLHRPALGERRPILRCGFCRVVEQAL